MREMKMEMFGLCNSFMMSPNPVFSVEETRCEDRQCFVEMDNSFSLIICDNTQHKTQLTRHFLNYLYQQQ